MCHEFNQVCERAAKYANRHDCDLATAERFIVRAWGKGTFGVEYASCGERELAYINTGDTYSTTVAREGDDGDCVVTSWGDWYESAEIAHCEETDTIRCGWCSHFTPMNRKDWRDVVCESCNHGVDGSE
jgi:hypothetical protein